MHFLPQFPLVRNEDNRICWFDDQVRALKAFVCSKTNLTDELFPGVCACVCEFGYSVGSVFLLNSGHTFCCPLESKPHPEHTVALQEVFIDQK